MRQVSPGFSPAAEGPGPQRAIWLCHIQRTDGLSRLHRAGARSALLGAHQSWVCTDWRLATVGRRGAGGGPAQPRRGRGTEPFGVGPHLLDIGDIWVVFGWHEQQVQPLIELDPVKGGNAHVQENPEEHGQGYLPEQVPDNHGEAWGGRGETVSPRAPRPPWTPGPSGKGGGAR